MPSGARSRKRRGAVNPMNRGNLPLNFITGLNNNNENEEEPMTPRTVARLSATRHVSLANQNRNAETMRRNHAAVLVKVTANAAEAARKTARNAAAAARNADEAAAAAKREAKRSLLSTGRSLLSKAGSTVIGSTKGGTRRLKRFRR